MEGAAAASEGLRYAEYARVPTGAGKGQAELDRGLVSAPGAGWGRGGGEAGAPGQRGGGWGRWGAGGVHLPWGRAGRRGVVVPAGEGLCPLASGRGGAGGRRGTAPA